MIILTSLTSFQIPLLLFSLDEPNMFLDILQLIPSIQEVNQIHLNAVQYIKRHEPHVFNSLPDVHRETYEGLSP